jgi:Tol biopolymer transport system component
MSTPDNKRISFVNDGPNAEQNIALTLRAAPSNADLLLPAKSLREPVGYYSWNHATGDVLYWSRYGYNISLAHTEKDNSVYISGNAVPSTPHLIPGSDNFSFVHRQGNESVWIKSLDPKTLAVRPLVSLPGSNSNYGWAPDGSIFLIERDRLFRWNENETDEWDDIADLADFNIQNAARLSISPNGKVLAIVGQAKE